MLLFVEVAELPFALGAGVEVVDLLGVEVLAEEVFEAEVLHEGGVVDVEAEVVELFEAERLVLAELALDGGVLEAVEEVGDDAVGVLAALGEVVGGLGLHGGGLEVGENGGLGAVRGLLLDFAVEGVEEVHQELVGVLLGGALEGVVLLR